MSTVTPLRTVQDLLTDELLNSSSNETVEILEFIKKNGVPLTDHQVRAVFMLNELELGDIADFALSVRPLLTSTKKYFEIVNKLTLADRIKGNAKLSSILKANANPANAVNQKGADGK
jgi:hypothetical protein